VRAKGHQRLIEDTKSGSCRVGGLRVPGVARRR
jgi:hypothetical protein